MESEAVQLPLWQQAWAWFEANKKPALWGAAGVAVVGVIVAGYLYHKNETEIAASEAVSNVALPQITGVGSGDMADMYLKVASTYPDTRGGARALLLAAGVLFVEGKYPDAKAQFERFTKDYSTSPLLSEALLGIASCVDAQGNAAEATAKYRDLIDHHPSEQVLPQARFALGRLYEAQNMFEQARNMYEEAARSDPYGALGSEAGMRLEELKLKHPNLAPAVMPMLTSTNQAPAPKR